MTKIILSLAVVLLGLLCPRVANAQTVINFPSGFPGSPSTIWLENSAKWVGSSIRLASGVTHTSTNAWFKTVENEEAFTTTFTFHIDCSVNPTNCGDGFGFMMVCACASNPIWNPPTDPGYTYSAFSSQNFSWSWCDPSSPSDPGCNKFPSSMLVKFDLYNNVTNKAGAEFTGFYTDGEFPQYPNPVFDMSGSGINIQSGDEFSCTITYDGSNLVETLTDTVTNATYSHTYTAVNIPAALGANTAFIGFGAGTGAALMDNYIDSWTYTVQTPGQAFSPAFSPLAGTYTGTQTVALSSASSGAVVCYSTTGTPATDGANSCTTGTLYTGPVTVSLSETLSAVAGGTGYADSPVASASYVIQTAVATPTFSPAPGTYASAQSVSLADTTSNATIYYTTNGTTPTTSSTAYTGPITVSSTAMLKAIAAAAGDSNSAVASAGYTITVLPVVATPTFSPAAGTYSSAQSVTISDATSGATTYYTTDGSTPTGSSTAYTGPITISSTQTLQAISAAPGDSNSAVASAAYTINPSLPATATPAFSPAAGTYTSAQSVTISDATADATIYYTINGATPTTSSTEYTGPITVSSTETLQAIAVAMGDGNSPIASSAYAINSSLPSVATPAFSPAAGAYSSAQSVALSDATSGATIYYTTDGTTPTPSSTVYAGPITVASTEMLQAIAIATGDSNSAIASAAYTIGSSLPSVATPTFSPAAGTYHSAQSVTISDATSGATIYFTTDGTTPTMSSTAYSGPIAVASTETLQAIAAASGDSAVASAAYTITAQPAFMLATSANSLTVNSGGQGSVTVTVTPENGFNSPVILACSGLPAWATCSFGETTVTPSAGAATTQLTISTTTQATTLPTGSRTFFPVTALAMTVWLFGWRKRRAWHPWLLLAVAYAGLGLLFGCGGSTGSGGTSSTAPTTSTVTITAISGTIQGTAAIAVTVN